MTTSTSLPGQSSHRDVAREALDHLIWHSLTTVHARFAQGTQRALRFDPEVAGFVALASFEDDAWSDLADLVGPDAEVALSGFGEVTPPPGWEPLGGGFGYQLVLDALPARLPAKPPVTPTIERLTSSDVPEMLALVELTKPGPFRARTIELGNYFGVRDAGVLVAMAGERLQTTEFTEISAVCTHPDARGRGLAAALTRHVAEAILARGQTPMLHVAETNVNARRVYERLGFVVRRRLQFTALRSPAHVSQDR